MALNDGLIYGEVKDAASGSPVEGARALLTYLGGDAGLAPIRILGNPQCDTDSSGNFLIGFQWDPLQLGNFLGVGGNPPCRVSIIGPTPDASHPTVKPYVTTRIGESSVARLYMVVSLRAIANGGIPNFTKPDSVAKTIGTEIVKKWRNYKRFPAIRLMTASPENYALLGYFATKLSVSAPPPAATANIAGQWDVTIGSWSGVFMFHNGGTCWWANSQTATRHEGRWWTSGNEVQWKFQDPGDIRTFSVTPGSGYGNSLNGRILPAGQGYFSMTRS